MSEKPKAPKAPIVTVEKQGVIAIVTLKKEPVNSMNMSLWKALYTEVDKLNKDASVRCIIFQSGLKKNVHSPSVNAPGEFGYLCISSSAWSSPRSTLLHKHPQYRGLPMV